jgi:hypothetical protein
MSASQIEHAFDVIWSIDKAADMRDVARFMSFA